MGESIQHKLDRIRPPRVQITYDVEIGDAIEKKELPFVVGIMADLSGKNSKKLDPLKERKFVEIDRDNFENVMNAAHPALDVKVNNWLNTGELRLLKLYKELHNTGAALSTRSAKTFLFNNADQLLKEASEFVKNFSEDKIKDIDSILSKIRNKADNSGELDDAGNDFLRSFNKLLRCFKFKIAKEKIELREDFKTLLEDISIIPEKKNNGTFNKKEILAKIETLENAILKDTSTLTCDLKFNNLDDFSPIRIIQQVNELKERYNIKLHLSDLLNKLDGDERELFILRDELIKLEEEKGDGEYDDGKISDAITNVLNKYYGTPESAEPKQDKAKKTKKTEEAEETKSKDKTSEENTNINPYMKTLLEQFFEQYKNNMVILEYSQGTIEANHIIRMLIEFVADLNELIGNQINEILHASEFQKLEASWKALHFLVKKSETGSRLKLRLLNITKADLQKDLEKAVEFDQSQLFKKVYEEEYGTFGGHPYGVLIGDFTFDRTAKDIALLTLISQVAAAAHAPFISAASPSLFGAETFKVIPEYRDLNAIFESLEMIKWNSFRESEDSRYVTLTLPRMLMRLPYGPNTLPVEGFDFTEDVDGTNHTKYLWANSSYALVQRITEAYAKYSWCAAIRGVEGGGLVQDLPAHVFDTDSGDKTLKCPTEIAITDRREKELSDLGFISLVHCKGKDYAAFFGGQTTQKPKVYDTPEANANARLSAVLPYIIASSRFAHYLKVIVRDKIGSFLTAENVQVYLNRWIGGYVLGKDDAGQEIKAQYPLREARVDVSDTPGKPGCYTAVVFLKPHFQLEELTTSIRLVAELPPPAA